MRRFITILVMCAGYLQCLNAQNNASFKGHVLDSVQKTPIAGCNIVISNGIEKAGTVSENDGSFEFDLTGMIRNDSLSITVSHINYCTKTILSVSKQDFRILLKPKVHFIDDVMIHSAYSSGNKGNKFVYTPLQAASSISIIGEPDVIRHISSLPGVAQGIEGTLGLFVRGSNNGSNRIEFNGVPFYSYSHLLGMFSAFSPDIIEQTTFRPGGIPVQSGNLSSSLLQIKPKQSVEKPFNGKISLSPYMTGGYLSIPLKKEKLSVQVAGRTSFMPFVINRIMDLQSSDDEEEVEEMKGQVLDFTAIADWKINSANTLDVMFYTSNDYFDFKDDYSQNKMNWNSNVVKVGWVSQISPLCSVETNAYFSSTKSVQEQLYFDEWQADKTKSQLRLGTTLNEWSLNNLLQYKINNRLEAKAGFSYQQQHFKPASEKTIYSQNSNEKYDELLKSGLLAAFADISYKNPGVVDLTVGYRHTVQRTDERTYNNFDLRLLSDIYLTDKTGIELSLDRLTQYYHVLEGLPTGWSLNVMIPSGKHFPEEITNQVYTGLFVKNEINNLNLHFTLGGYYRHMQNLVSYISTVNLFGLNDTSWEDEVDVGEGHSYGIELSGAAQANRFGLTLAYTLSKATRQFPKINYGSAYPFKFDRRHILNLQSKYTTLKRTNKKGYKQEQHINTVLVYSSGHNTTLPVGTYRGVMPPYWNIRDQGWDFPQQLEDNAYHRQEMTTKNGFKMKDYLRVDIAYTFIKHRPKSTRELSFSVFNVLNRQNPYLFFYEDDRWQQLSIAPIMPSVRWTIRF
nr:TonB-dependent receptor [uncultured Draconibacterium sp.]